MTRRALGLGPTDPVPRCWSWACPGCSQLLAWGVRRYLKGGMLEAHSRGEVLRFWTLTDPSMARSWDASSAALTRLFGAERDRARRAEQPVARWVAVPELQKRGAVHWHGLVALHPEAVHLSAFRSTRALRRRALGFGFGFMDDVQAVEPEEVRRRAWYVAKYCTKDVRLGRSVSNRYRRVRSSTGAHRWFSHTVTASARSWQEAQATIAALEQQLQAVEVA